MKTKILLCLFMFALHLPLLAQTKTTNLSSSIVGTWKMLSMTGTNTDGTPIKMDLTKGKQYKIITPTHWMYINHNPDDSLTATGDGGTYKLKGNKYVEDVTDAKTEFTVKVEGNKYYQDGSILLPDGKIIVLHEVYQRIEEPINQKNEMVGVWNMVSAYNIQEGKKTPVLKKTELQITTPSYYMWVTKKDGKLLNCMVGTYKIKENIILPTPILASFPIDKSDKVQIATSFKGDHMTTIFTLTKVDGSKQEGGGVYQRVDKPKLANAVSR